MNTGARFAVITVLALMLMASGCRLIGKGIDKLVKNNRDKEAAAAEADTGMQMDLVISSSGLRTVYLIQAEGGDGTMAEACAKSRGSLTIKGSVTAGGAKTALPGETTLYPEPNCEATAKPQTARVITDGEAKLVYSNAQSGCSGSYRIPADAVAQIADGLAPGEVVTWQISEADEIQPLSECLMRHVATSGGLKNPKCTVRDRQPCQIQLQDRGMVETCSGELEVTCTSN